MAAKKRVSGAARRRSQKVRRPRRTFWHLAFAEMMHERAAPGFEVVPEVWLTLAPQVADLVLLRKRALPRRQPPEQGPVLRGLWPRLGTDTIVEFKSRTKPLRPGELVGLLGYGAQYHRKHLTRLAREQLTLVLVVARASPTLTDDVAALGWTQGPTEQGYAPLVGGPYPAWVAFLDQVACAERDDLLRPFSSPTLDTLSEHAWTWWQAHLTTPFAEKTMQDIQRLEGYEEAAKALLASVAAMPEEMRRRLVAGLEPALVEAVPVDLRLDGLTPEQRLDGLTPEQLVELREALRRRGV
jgi:hypothetical protein